MYEGNYTGIYLNESNRKRNNEASEYWTTRFITEVRYGKFTSEHINYLQHNMATEAETKQDSWKNKVTLCAKHYYNEKNPEAINVETLNVKELIKYAEVNKLDLVKIEAQHFPVEKEKHLKRESAKLFRNLPAVIGLCKGVNMMLCENINPSVGLFNGAEVKYIGQIYLPKCYDLCINENTVPDVILKSGITTEAFKCRVKSKDEYIPKGTKVMQNDERVNYNNMKEIPAGSEIKLHLPENFPSLPDYLVIQVPNFDEVTGGGDNILFRGRPDLANCTLISPRMYPKETKQDKKDNIPTDYRTSFPVELIYAFSGFKGIGATIEKLEGQMEGMCDVPGLGYVVLTRVRQPEDLHIPPSQFPNYLDFRLQRLKNIVIESENFEREIRIKCAKTEVYRMLSEEQKIIAELIITGWRNLKENETIISENNFDLAAFNEVADILENTDVNLLKKPTQPLGKQERERLENYRKSKKAKKRTSSKQTKTNPSTANHDNHNNKRKNNNNVNNNNNNKNNINNNKNNNNVNNNNENNNNWKSSNRKNNTTFTPNTKPQPAPSRFTNRTLPQLVPKLINHGTNICWLNSSMQIILLLLKESPVRIRVVDELEKKIWEQTQLILNEYESTHVSLFVNNIDFRGERWSVRRLFSNIAQNNNGLDRDNQQDVYLCLNNFLRNQDKLPNNEIAYRQAKVCQGCNFNFEVPIVNENIIQIRVQEGPVIDITQALLRIENIEGVCSNCNSIQQLEESTQFVQTPDLMLIDLYRWNIANRPVISPLASFDDIHLFTESNGETVYNVIATITYERHGDSGGHYFASIRMNNNQWIKADDTTLSLDVGGPKIPRLLLLKKVN